MMRALLAAIAATLCFAGAAVADPCDTIGDYYNPMFHTSQPSNFHWFVKDQDNTVASATRPTTGTVHCTRITLVNGTTGTVTVFLTGKAEVTAINTPAGITFGMGAGEVRVFECAIVDGYALTGAFASGGFLIIGEK